MDVKKRFMVLFRLMNGDFKVVFAVVTAFTRNITLFSRLLHIQAEDFVFEYSLFCRYVPAVRNRTADVSFSDTFRYKPALEFRVNTVQNRKIHPLA